MEKTNKYTSIEDVEKVYDELLIWDKEKFLRKHLKDIKVNYEDVRYDNAKEIITKLGLTDDELLDLVSPNSVDQYCYEHSIEPCTHVW